MLMEPKSDTITFTRAMVFNKREIQVPMGVIPADLFFEEIPPEITDNISKLETVELQQFMKEHTAARLSKDFDKGVEQVIASLKDFSRLDLSNVAYQKNHDRLATTLKALERHLKKLQLS